MSFLSSMNPSSKLMNLRVVLGTLKLAAVVRLRVVLETPNLLVTEVSVVLGFLNFATLKKTPALSHMARTPMKAISIIRLCGHYILTPILVDRSLLSHSMLRRAYH